MNPAAAQQPPAETYESLASLIDYHLLEPTLSSDEIAQACHVARDYRVRAIVLRSCDVELVAQWMSGSPVVIAGAAGYPDGTATTATKLYEGRDLLRVGAKEIEFVLNPTRAISRQFPHIETELMQIAKSCNESGAKLTVVYNSRWLAEDHKIIVTKICRRVEAHLVSIDNSDADLQLLRPMLKDVLQLKSATPVTSLEEALTARAAGYARIATLDPAPVLDAWRAHLSTQAKPEAAVS